MMENIDLLKENRIASKNYHQNLARFWSVLLIFANGLIGFILCFGVYIIAKTKSLSLFAVVVYPVWKIAGKIRQKASYHQRLTRGFEQSYAEELIDDIIKDRKPFALYLRCFELERMSAQYKGINEDTDLSDSTLSARPFELILTEILNIPIVTLTDPRTKEPFEGAHRFHKIPDNWQNYIAFLIERASLIFLYISEASPGISDEVRLIKNSNAELKTITVINKNADINDSGFYVGRLLKEQTSKKWSRKMEEEFQQNFLVELQLLVEKQNLNGSILNLNPNLKLTTPHTILKCYKFIKGPFLASSILTVFMLIIEFNAVSNHNLDSKKALDDSLVMVEWFPLSFMILIFLKLLYSITKTINKKGFKLGKQAVERFI